MRYILTGGGTGGHVYPALALKEIISETDAEAEYLYIGVRGKAEEYIIGSDEHAQSLPIEYIHASGLPRRFAPGQLFNFIREFVRGYWESRTLIAEFNPDLVAATGGYVTAPVIAAARRRGIKVLLHEQNSVPGLVNKTIGRFADRIFLTFQDSLEYFDENKSKVVGYPVRKRIRLKDKRSARSELGIPLESEVAFVFGGSSGAKILNETIVQNLELLMARESLIIIHGTGRDRPGLYNAYSDTAAMKNEIYPDELTAGRYILKDYFTDIDTVYSAADLVICRAGAGTLMECASLGLPMIIVPKAGLPGNHQVKNARSAEKTGGAVIVSEELYKKRTILDGENLAAAIISTISDRDLLEKMSISIANLFIPNTNDLIKNEIRKLLNAQ
ncbi:glycosyltransferase [candidate division KSB1 bacterium]